MVDVVTYNAANNARKGTDIIKSYQNTDSFNIDNFGESILNTTKWTQVNESTGSTYIKTGYIELNTGDGAAGGTITYGNIAFDASDQVGVSSINDKTIMEFGFYPSGLGVNPGSISESNANLFGMIPTSAATGKGAANIAGLVVSGGIFNFLTNEGGTEEMTDVSSYIGWDSGCKIKLERSSGKWELFVNGISRAEHETAVPECYYPTFGVRTGSGPLTIQIRGYRMYYQ